MRMHGGRPDDELRSALLRLERHIEGELVANPLVDIPESLTILRQRAFTASPDELGAAASRRAEPWLIVVDLGYPEAVVTLIAAMGGTTWVGFEKSRGLLRIHGDPGVTEAAEQLLRSAATQVTEDVRSGVPRRPGPGRVTFHVREGDRVRSAEASARDLLEGHHPLSPLFRSSVDLLEAVQERLGA